MEATASDWIALEGAEVGNAAGRRWTKTTVEAVKGGSHNPPDDLEVTGSVCEVLLPRVC